MAEPEDVVAAVNSAPNDPRIQDHGGNGRVDQSYWSVAKSLFFRAMIIYFISSLFRKQPATTNVGNEGINKLPPASNMFDNGSLFDMYVFVSENEKYPNFSDESLVWREKNLIYGDFQSGPNRDGTLQKDVKIKTTHKMRNNGTIYLHTYLISHPKYSKVIQWPDVIKKLKNDKDNKVVHYSKMLNKFAKRYYVKKQNLLTGETTASEEEVRKAEKVSSEIVSHWHPNLTIALVTDFTIWAPNTVAPPFNEYIHFVIEDNNHKYKPVVFYNDFWNLKRDYTPINETVEWLNMTLTYQPMSILKWQVFAVQSTPSKWSLYDSDEDVKDQDSLKEMLLDTSPYLIAATVVVTILHSIFEILAFKNDIQFWKNRQSLEGLSVRMVMFNVFQTLVVFLYVMDNEGNVMIMISCFIGFLIEAWKITKVVDISIDRERKFMGTFPKLNFKDKGSYVESSTKEYDELAFKYLSWVLFPLFAGYCTYSLIYQEHKGWYSWVLNMMYGFLLTFGFIMMTPQLFINYKLKSVAHLPWRMMSYKCLNTFIDDIFAFIIKMPMMYRIGCLRDDIIFFIFLYQRWIYKMDPTRVNEFGYSLLKENGGTVVASIAENEGLENRATLPIPTKEESVVAKSDKQKKCD